MILRDLHTSIELEVEGYQFPDIGPGEQPEDPDSWDSNWLNIRGTVTTGGDSSWSFQHPCLTTWEVVELADWFQNVAAGLVPLLPAGAEELSTTFLSTRAGWLTFTEPNLSFGVEARSAGRVNLLIGLSHELAQPPLDPRRPRRSQITIEITPQHAHDAAALLLVNSATFPAR